MKNFLTLTAVVILSASAFAVGNGRSSRAIPAPSEWTPPERIKHAPVQIVRPIQPKKLGGGMGFSTPTFSTPAFNSPRFSNPGFGVPTFGTPGFSSPGSVGSPGFGTPGFSSPGGVGTPGFSSPGFNRPTTSF